MDLKTRLGARIRELRVALGYSQDILGEKIDMETPNISNIERGKRFLLPENIEKMAKALKVEVKELFDFNHFENRDKLTDEIKQFLNDASLKDIQFIYKFTRNLKEYNK